MSRLSRAGGGGSAWSLRGRLARLGGSLRRHPWRTGLGVLALCGVGLFLASALWEYGDARKAKMLTSGPYRADLDSLKSRPLPAWFDDAKFGIMIHWGLYSVPGYAPKGTFIDILGSNYDRAMVSNPYAEDYWNAMKAPDSPTGRWHRERYGSLPYEAFQAQFEADLAAWDPDAWARQFQEAGARYVVFTAKYADGYCLWPTKVANPHQPDWYSERDLIGELAAAVRGRGMKFGLYYSGGVDWTFQRQTVETLGDYAYLPYGADYADYAEAQVRELIARYQPDILWNDIAWPTGQARLNALFADYYNTVPEGVVNDRWQTNSFWHRLMGLKPLRGGFDLLIKALFLAGPEAVDEVNRPRPMPHSDFTTPEYTQYETTQAKKWENDRGIGNSFGYNREETDADYASFEGVLLPELINAVAKNGNYLLNVGPSGGAGAIVPEQAARLRDLGAWLSVNGAGIYGTRPWTRAEATTSAQLPVRLARSGDNLYLIIVGRPTGTTLVVQDLALRGAAVLLADNSPVELREVPGGTELTFVRPLDGQLAPVIRVAGQP